MAHLDRSGVAQQSREAVAALRALDRELGGSNPKIADQLDYEIDVLPPRIAQLASKDRPDVIPKSTTDALENAAKLAEQMTRFGASDSDDRTRKIRAAATVALSRLQLINESLGPDQIEQQVLVPNMQRFGS